MFQIGIVVSLLLLASLLARLTIDYTAFNNFATIAQMRAEEAAFQLALCDMLYSDGFSELPALAELEDWGGPTIGSWRFKRYVAVQGVPTYMYSTEQAWDSDGNSPLRETSPSGIALKNSSMAKIMLITGEGGAIGELTPTNILSVHPERIIAVSVSNTGKHWMEPGDISLHKSGSIDLHLLESDADKSSMLIAFGDGAVWRVSRNIPDKLLLTYMRGQWQDNNNRESDFRRYIIARRKSCKR